MLKPCGGFGIIETVTTYLTSAIYIHMVDTLGNSKTGSWTIKRDTAIHKLNLCNNLHKYQRQQGGVCNSASL